MGGFQAAQDAFGIADLKAAEPVAGDIAAGAENPRIFKLELDKPYKLFTVWNQPLAGAQDICQR